MNDAQKAAWDKLTSNLSSALSVMTEGLPDIARAKAYEAISDAYMGCCDGFPWVGRGYERYREDYHAMAQRYAKKASDLREIIRLGL